MPHFQEQSTQLQGTAVYDLDIIKIKFVVIFIQCCAKRELLSHVKTVLLCSCVLDLSALDV